MSSSEANIGVHSMHIVHECGDVNYSLQSLNYFYGFSTLIEAHCTMRTTGSVNAQQKLETHKK